MGSSITGATCRLDASHNYLHLKLQGAFICIHICRNMHTSIYILYICIYTHVHIRKCIQTCTYSRFQVLTAASMKFRFVFWDVLPCKIIVDRRFRGTCCLHHQGDSPFTVARDKSGGVLSHQGFGNNSSWCRPINILGIWDLPAVGDDKLKVMGMYGLCPTAL
jgi:hypothetical protein